VKCIRCKADLGRKPRAAIAIMVGGDERIQSWFWCDGCAVYTGEDFHDRFLGDSDAHAFGPIAKAEGDRIVALVAACPNPQNKYCDCASHRALV
jgi:hypothetical protein